MKVLHINTLDKGGAAKASLRLQKGLRDCGISSEMLVLYRENTDQSHIHAYHNEMRHDLWQKIQHSLAYRWDSFQKKQMLYKKPTNYEVFSFPQTVYNIAKHPLVQQADIIHLHWVANFLDYRSFFKQIQKPIVWTLHDLNPLSTSGFHYEHDEQNLQNEFAEINQFIHQIKLEGITHAEQLRIVPITKWIAQKSKKSQLLRRFKHEFIPNGLDLQIFKPTDQEASRKILGLPLDKKIVLFIADSIDNQRKGFSYLREALHNIPTENVVLAIVGRGSFEQMPCPTYPLDFIFDDRLLATVYDAVDVCVVPSLEDNMPNTVLEAMACQTATLAFAVGGIPEMIKSQKNGLLARQQDSKDLAQKLQFLLEEDEYRLLYAKNARQTVENHFDVQFQAQKFIKLYADMLNLPKNSFEMEEKV